MSSFSEWRKGTKITLRHAEIQEADGHIETGNIDIYYKSQPDVPFQTDIYILNGGDEVLSRILLTMDFNM